MKKATLLFAVLTFLITLNINGQSSTTKFGIKAGANFAQYTPDFKIGGIELAQYNRKLGFYIGGFATIKIADKVNIQPELMFAMQGTNILIEDIEISNPEGITIIVADYESDINESTISVPVVFQYLFNDKLYMEGGPQFGYIFNRKETIKKDPLDQLGGVDITDDNFDYDKFDFGLTFGIGFKISKNIGINSRYFFGLIERNNTIKSSVFNLGIEYQF